MKSILMLCSEHMRERATAEESQAFAHAVMETGFQHPSFVSLIESGLDLSSNGAESAAKAMEGFHWKAMCCMLGQDEIDRIWREEMPKVLLWGGKSVPL